MAIPATDDWFSFSIRRNRQSYILASILLIVVMAVVYGSLLLFSSSKRASIVIIVLFLIPYAICSYSLTAQRLRDMNVTGWLALLWIPITVADNYIGGAASLFFLIVLSAVPGTAGGNTYGPDPLERQGNV